MLRDFGPSQDGCLHWLSSKVVSRRRFPNLEHFIVPCDSHINLIFHNLWLHDISNYYNTECGVFIAVNQVGSPWQCDKIDSNNIHLISTHTYIYIYICI